MIQTRMVVLSLGSFLLGLLGCAAVLHILILHPLDLHADIRSEKLVIMRNWQGRATAAAFGSSHVHNGFDPRRFDAELAEAGIQERSLNLGVAGGSQTEQRQMALEFVRQLKPSAQPLVLLELNAGANLTNDHLVHPRSINLYDSATLRFAWTLVTPEMGRKREWGRRTYALAAWALHELNFGMVSSRIFSAPLDMNQLSEETDDDRRGLLATFRPATRNEEIQHLIQADDHDHRTFSGEIDPGNRTLPEELVHASSVPNLKVAYFVTPKLNDLTAHAVWPNCLKTAIGPVAILPLNRPELLREMYHDPANWADDSHLSEKGATLLTTALAKLWLEWLRQGSPAALRSGCGA